MEHDPSEEAYRRLGRTQRIDPGHMAPKDVPRAAAGALAAGDESMAYVLADEAARRLAVADEEKAFAAELSRIAEEMEGFDGLPGPLFEASNHNLTVYDRQLRVVHAGPKALKKLGLTPEAVIGKRLGDYLRQPQIAATFEREVERALRGGLVRGDLWVEIAAGRRFYSYVMAPIRRGLDVVAVAVLAADLTHLATARQ